MANYSIVESQFPVVGGIGGHNLLVLKDPDGKVIGELEGLATGADGAIKPIGTLPSDKLMVYLSNQAYLYDPDQAQIVLKSGDRATIMNLWAAAAACGGQINNLNLAYPVFGFGDNSNSVASTLVSCLGFSEPSIPGGALITPGQGSVLLNQSTIKGIQSQYNIQSPHSENSSDVVPSVQVTSNPDALDGSQLWLDSPPAGSNASSIRRGIDTPPANAQMPAGSAAQDLATQRDSATSALPQSVQGQGGDKMRIDPQDGGPDDWFVPAADGYPDDWFVPASAASAQPALAPPRNSNNPAMRIDPQDGGPDDWFVPESDGYPNDWFVPAPGAAGAR